MSLKTIKISQKFYDFSYQFSCSDVKIGKGKFGGKGGEGDEGEEAPAGEASEFDVDASYGDPNALGASPTSKGKGDKGKGKGKGKFDKKIRFDFEI